MTATSTNADPARRNRRDGKAGEAKQDQTQHGDDPSHGHRKNKKYQPSRELTLGSIGRKTLNTSKSTQTGS